MTEAQWLEVQRALDDSKAKLEKELSDDYDDASMFDNNKNLLKKLLQEHWHEADNSGSP